MTLSDFDSLWRGNADFIGPVGPPMLLWLRDRERQREWEFEHAIKRGAPRTNYDDDNLFG